MKKLLPLIFLFLCFDAQAATYSSDDLMDAISDCTAHHDQYPAVVNDYECTGDDGTALTAESNCVYSGNIASGWGIRWCWQNDICPDTSVFNPATQTCECPSNQILIGGVCSAAPPRDSQECLDVQGDDVTFAAPQNSPYVGDVCVDGCIVDNHIGSSNGDSEISYLGRYNGESCVGSDVNTYTDAPPGLDDDGCKTIGDDTYCNATADSPATVNGDPIPNHDADSATQVSDDYASDDDVVNDDGDGDADVDTIYDDDGTVQNIHEDYQSLPPNTPVDTNGDGKTDSSTVDTNGDGISDGIVGNDGTTVATDGADGSPGIPGTPPPVNDDGSPNYPDAPPADEEPACEDDPATPEDDCSGQDKKSATTPYCQGQPSCEGDVHQCANIYQNWQILCANSIPEEQDTSLSLQNDLPEDGGLGFYNPDSTDDNINFANVVLNEAGFGLTRTCPMPYQYTIFSEVYEFSYQPICDISELLAYIILIIATLVSINIVMTRN